MHTQISIIFLVFCLFLAACQPGEATLPPTVAVQPVDTPLPTATAAPVQPDPTLMANPIETPLPEGPVDAGWQETSEDGGELTCGEYLLSNNTWGKGDLTGYSQSIGTSGEPGNCRFRWSWDWPRSSLTSVRAYPEIIFGWKPWSPASTTLSLPIQLSAIQSIDVQLQFNAQAVGRYNSAFDLWLTSTNPPTDKTITREIMIWVGEAEMAPAGTKVASLEVAGVPYNLYKIQWDWTYLAFTQETSEPPAVIPVSDFLRYLVDNQHVQADEYLASIEFGNEIVYGTGETLVEQFIVKIK